MNLDQRLATILALVAMARPLQLVAVTLVYMMGTTIAAARDIDFDLIAFTWGYLALIPVSASIHYANEYADFETDALTNRTPFSGGSGALPRTRLSPYVAWIAAWVVLLLGGSVALGGLVTGHLSFAALGTLLFGAVFGWMYSVPPLALAWRGWGELDNAMLGGIALPLFGYTVQSGRVEFAIIAASFPFGALVFANLLATTWPDRGADALVGKYTLATRWPVSRLRVTYGLTILAAFGSLVALTGWVLPPLVVLAGLGVLPVSLWGAFSYTRWRSPFPSVAAMIILLLIYVGAWAWTIDSISLSAHW